MNLEAIHRGELATRISRSTAALLTGALVLLIGGVPVVQALLDRQTGKTSPFRQLVAQWPTKKSIAAFEQSLEDASSLRSWVRPQVQTWLTAHGGFGNTKTVVGRDGWLFYAPGITSITGPGLLDGEIHDVRRRAAVDAEGPPVHPDPRPAILEFHRALQARGIRLVLLPVPDKASVEPHHLHRRRVGEVPLGNVDEQRLWRELREAGVEVFEPTPARIDGERARFLVQDTHWTPAWMKEVAEGLAHVLRPGLPGTEPRDWRTSRVEVERVGDLVDMLRLPAQQRLFPPQRVQIEQVRDEAGQPFRPQTTADLLLLGDSFTNIFSLPAMGWGEAAGLGPHLAAALGRDLDVIAQNDAGAFATRQLLARELAAGQDRLAGKRVVVWQFAARELAVGDWRPVDWTPTQVAAAPSARRFFAPQGPISVEAEVLQASPVPRPSEVPYKDHVRALHLRLLPGGSSQASGEALAYVQSMRDGQWLPGARLTAGMRIKLRLQPWSAVSAGIEGVNRSELDDVSLLEAEPVWAELDQEVP